MSPIIVKESAEREKIVYKGDKQDFTNQIRFPNQFEIVPPVQFRLWSLHSLATQKLS